MSFVFLLVAKNSSLFNDKSMEIQDLTLSVKQDISNMNRQIAQLQQVYIKLSFSNDVYLYSIFCFKYMNETHGTKSKNSQTHSNSVVFVLQVNSSFLNSYKNKNEQFEFSSPS